MLNIPEVVDEHADAGPCLELDKTIAGADCDSASYVVDRDGATEEQEGVDRDLKNAIV